MSKIAADESYGGNQLRKAIDYFSHLAVAPEFYGRIARGDPGFTASEFFPTMAWLKDANDDIYDPSYTDMLRVAFTSEFRRGKLQDLVDCSGRNFETKEYQETIAEQSFARLKQAVLNFIKQTHFERLVMILRSAGFVSSSLISGQNAVNFAYILYLRGRLEKMAADDIERVVRRWFVMSLLTGRYSGNPETPFFPELLDGDRRSCAGGLGIAHLGVHAVAVLFERRPCCVERLRRPKSRETSAISASATTHLARPRLWDPRHHPSRAHTPRPL